MYADERENHPLHTLKKSVINASRHTLSPSAGRQKASPSIKQIRLCGNTECENRRAKGEALNVYALRPTQATPYTPHSANPT